MSWWDEIRLRYGSAKATQSAVQSLTKISDEIAVRTIGRWSAFITRKLGDGGQTVRQAYLDFARQSPAVLSKLIIEHDPMNSTNEPYELARALGLANTTHSNQQLVEILKLGSAKIKDSASRAIRAIEVESRFVAIYQQWLNAEQRELREEAVRSLAKISPQVVAEHLKNEQNPQVRFAATKALKDVNWPITTNE